MLMLKGKCEKCFEIILQKVGKCKKKKKINEENGKGKSKSRKWVYHKTRNDPWSDYL